MLLMHWLVREAEEVEVAHVLDGDQSGRHDRFGADATACRLHGLIEHGELLGEGGVRRQGRCARKVSAVMSAVPRKSMSKKKEVENGADEDPRGEEDVQRPVLDDNARLLDQSCDQRTLARMRKSRMK